MLKVNYWVMDSSGWDVKLFPQSYLKAHYLGGIGYEAREKYHNPSSKKQIWNLKKPRPCAKCGEVYSYRKICDKGVCVTCTIESRRNHMMSYVGDACINPACGGPRSLGSLFCAHHKRGNREVRVMDNCKKCCARPRAISKMFRVDTYCVECGIEVRSRNLGRFEV